MSKEQPVESPSFDLGPFFDENGITDHDQAAFEYYFRQTPDGAVPEWTWGMFDRGWAAQGSYPGYDLDYADKIGGLLVPNYRQRAHGLRPVLDSMKPYAEDIDEALEAGSLLVTVNHPTLPTPLFPARAIIEALKEKRPDIQERITLTYGVLPTVFRYKFDILNMIEGIKSDEVSPVGLATAVGNLALTAAVSDSNLEPTLKEWQTVYRDWYKATIAGKLSVPGNVVVVVLNGQRDVAYTRFNPRARKINQPEGGIDAFIHPNTQLLNCAVFDHLLEDPAMPISPVQMYVHPKLQPVTGASLRHVNHWQADVLDPTYDGHGYHHEGLTDLKDRMAERVSGLRDKILHRQKD